jgi:hypothetical protein
VFGNTSRVGTQSGIEQRLAAACLVAREFHAYARSPQHAHAGLPDLREERIYEARDEELSSSHASIVYQCHPGRCTVVAAAGFRLAVQYLVIPGYGIIPPL